MTRVHTAESPSAIQTKISDRELRDGDQAGGRHPARPYVDMDLQAAAILMPSQCHKASVSFKTFGNLTTTADETQKWNVLDRCAKGAAKAVVDTAPGTLPAPEAAEAVIPAAVSRAGSGIICRFHD